MVTPKWSMSTERETLHVSSLSYNFLDMSNLGDAAGVNSANCKTQNAFLFPVHDMFRHDCPLAVKPASTPRRLVHKRTWTDSLLIDTLLSDVSVLVVAPPSSEFPEGLTKHPVYYLVS